MVSCFTLCVSQNAPDPEHLGNEDAYGDEKLRRNSDSSPQVLRGQLPQIHRHHIGGEPWNQNENISLTKDTM